MKTRMLVLTLLTIATIPAAMAETFYAKMITRDSRGAAFDFAEVTLKTHAAGVASATVVPLTESRDLNGQLVYAPGFPKTTVDMTGVAAIKQVRGFKDLGQDKNQSDLQIVQDENQNFFTYTSLNWKGCNRESLYQDDSSYDPYTRYEAKTLWIAKDQHSLIIKQTSAMLGGCQALDANEVMEQVLYTPNSQIELTRVPSLPKE